MGEKETSGQELAKVYQGGATLAKTGAETGLGRFAVAYRLKKAGVERRNRGTPQKTLEEKAAFARQQLAGIFGESLPEVIDSLRTNAVTAKELAVENEVKYSTLRTWLKRAGIVAANPPPADSVDKNGGGVRIWDLIDIDDNLPEANSILKRFADLRLSAQKVAAASVRQLKILGFTPKEIVYMRGQLKKRPIGS